MCCTKTFPQNVDAIAIIYRKMFHRLHVAPTSNSSSFVGQIEHFINHKIYINRTKNGS